MLDEINKIADSVREKAVKFRRDIHRAPELSGSEKNTSSFVAGVLEANDIEVKRGGKCYGVVGLLKGGRPGRTVALRADMDALPIQDRKCVDYSSAVPGVMHACGHDVHTAILMGTAMTLSSVRDRLKGNVKFIFQPSEEKSSISGARQMIEEGALEDPAPSAIVALHCFPEMEVGGVAHRAGVMTASADRLRIVIKGRSGHASRPHQTVDAVLVSSLVINSIHHIVSRRTDPLHHAVISIGTISGGTAANIIAERVEMEGTVRTLDEAARKKIPVLIEQTIKGIADGMGASYELVYEYGTPSVVNDKAVDDTVATAASDVLGESNVIEMPEPLMGAEDFAYYAERVPGTIFRLGTSNKRKGITAPLHNSEFDVDEDSIAIGIKVLSWAAVKLLG